MGLEILARDNVAAWCVVPYDSLRRGPVERAAMLADLGIGSMVWDWRDEHVPFFEDELDALAAHGIGLTGIWCPLPQFEDGVPDAVAGLVATAAGRGLAPQLWTCIEFAPPWEGPVPQDQWRRVAEASDRIAPLAALGAEHGMQVGLYNHMGWFGEPENQVAVLEALDAEGFANAGLVYQQHHGHAQVERFASMWPAIAPYVIALGLNGMLRIADEPGVATGGSKIHPYGHGPDDVDLARAVVDSGWTGPITLLGHTMDDVALRLADNLEGLDWVRDQLAGTSTADAPPPARIPQPIWPH